MAEKKVHEQSLVKMRDRKAHGALAGMSPRGVAWTGMLPDAMLEVDRPVWFRELPGVRNRDSPAFGWGLECETPESSSSKACSPAHYGPLASSGWIPRSN
jgi:hypothetical protein